MSIVQDALKAFNNAPIFTQTIIVLGGVIGTLIVLFVVAYYCSALSKSGDISDNKVNDLNNRIDVNSKHNIKNSNEIKKVDLNLKKAKDNVKKNEKDTKSYEKKTDDRIDEIDDDVQATKKIFLDNSENVKNEIETLKMENENLKNTTENNINSLLEVNKKIENLEEKEERNEQKKYSYNNKNYDDYFDKNGRQKATRQAIEIFGLINNGYLKEANKKYITNYNKVNQKEKEIIEKNFIKIMFEDYKENRYRSYEDFSKNNAYCKCIEDEKTKKTIFDEMKEKNSKKIKNTIKTYYSNKNIKLYRKPTKKNNNLVPSFTIPNFFNQNQIS